MYRKLFIIRLVPETIFSHFTKDFSIEQFFDELSKGYFMWHRSTIAQVHTMHGNEIPDDFLFTQSTNSSRCFQNKLLGHFHDISHFIPYLILKSHKIRNRNKL